MGNEYNKYDTYVKYNNFTPEELSCIDNHGINTVNGIIFVKDTIADEIIQIETFDTAKIILKEYDVANIDVAAARIAENINYYFLKKHYSK